VEEAGRAVFPTLVALATLIVRCSAQPLEPIGALVRLSVAWLPKNAISKKRKRPWLHTGKIALKLYRTPCLITSLQPSLARERNFFSCNVALGEPIFSMICESRKFRLKSTVPIFVPHWI